jgi:hypothetical protein
MQSRCHVQNLVINTLGTRYVQHKVMVVDIRTNNLVLKKTSGQPIETQDFQKLRLDTQPLHIVNMLITQQGLAFHSLNRCYKGPKTNS